MAPGLLVERVFASEESPVKGGDRCITLVRVDPARYRFVLLTAKAHGGDKPVTEWLRQHKLTGVINASMYGTDRRSVGLMIDGPVVNNGHDSEKFGGFLAFGPTKPGLAPISFLGRSCPGFDLSALRERYKTVIQNYRLLDCEGKAIPWKDEKVFSAAAIGEDKQGRVVLIHARTPYSMTAFGAMLAAPALGLTSAHYVEGGPEASLLVEAGGAKVRELGSYETNFRPDDTNDEFWAIPNVVGFLPKEP